MGKNPNYASPATLYDIPKATMRIFFLLLILVAWNQVWSRGIGIVLGGLTEKEDFPEINLPIRMG